MKIMTVTISIDLNDAFQTPARDHATDATPAADSGHGGGVHSVAPSPTDTSGEGTHSNIPSPSNKRPGPNRSNGAGGAGEVLKEPIAQTAPKKDPAAAPIMAKDIDAIRAESREFSDSATITKLFEYFDAIRNTWRLERARILAKATGPFAENDEDVLRQIAYFMKVDELSA